MKINSQTLRIAVAVAIILGSIAYLAITGIENNKAYYVTISELQGMGNKAYTRHLRVSGNVAPGTIERNGANAQFVLSEQGRTLKVNYQGEEPPPDTFKDDAQALAIGTLGRDGIFHATQLQAKCASKYAPANTPGAAQPTHTAALTSPAVPARQ
ncbi:MAG TPA: cytochrome c maturation protein CcmE [Acidobacteriaceae bacterium]|nr:cytochrome c maturation protein CcmE [Acidobacteriaceae bacterium]